MTPADDTMSASCTRMGGYGNEAGWLMQENDHICIDIPGPGNAQARDKTEENIGK